VYKVAQDIEYVVPQSQLEIWQKAYDSGRKSLDILKKLRIAGMPNAEGEVRDEAGMEKERRAAGAFNVELKE